MQMRFSCTEKTARSEIRGWDFTCALRQAGSKPAEEASRGGIPQENEWDAILKKDAGLIKNDLNVYSCARIWKRVAAPNEL